MVEDRIELTHLMGKKLDKPLIMKWKSETEHEDVMIFPDTWEEFEKHHGFCDSKQAYMYGNTRLIPSFRVQQWLDHIDDTKCKEQSQKNKMKQVAEMFGKKLGEEFWARIVGNKFEIKCRFTESGFQQTVVDGQWHDNDAFLGLLLNDKAEIVDD